MKQPNRIVIVLNDTGRGGAETQALYLSKGLVERGYEVHVLSFGSKKGSYWGNFESAGVHLHLTGFNAKLLLPSNSLRSFLNYIRYNIQFIRILRSLKPQVIVPFTYLPNVAVARCWRLTGAKVSFWNQRDEGRMFQGTTWEVKALNSVTEIISNSLEGALFLKNYTKRPISILHNGVVLPEFQIRPTASSKIRVVMVANLHGYKDHITLLKAWKIIVETNNTKSIELVLAGSDGDTASTIKQYIADNHLEDTVNCVGMVTNVYELLVSSDIGVFSSMKEGLPNGILECMAVGLPVVATKINGAIEALGEDYPFLVESYNEVSFAQMILQLINDSDLRSQIGLQNRNRIKEQFDIDKMVNQYQSLFKI
ncbi:glycosyltransferase [Flavobacterium psychrotolerans]|uniref:Uncharacterized protein n=1 Tax=Flavobacterium psychrotolerans TaxID=2169410 RepID=A0A2U1JJ25_9FLAO|nr:glycosyltransferase [Flavobacterium psychrotolerans]PWA04863.1 hypothetical protein DB895_08840 [Flavobacterium psychrotolerans]